MTQAQLTAQEAVGSPVESDISMFELMRGLPRHKKKIAAITGAAIVLASAISLALPNVYEASTKLMPPQQQQASAMSVLSQLGGMAGAAAGGLTGMKNPNDLYVGMLKSRTIADRLVNRFDLKKVYDLESQEKARKRLEANTTIVAGKDGLISIDVEDLGQKRVAQIANGYVEELTRLTRTLAVTEAARRRLFFEQQLEQSKNNLLAAETALKGALDSRGVINVDSETRAVMETVVRLKAQISAKQIQLNSMGAFVTQANNEYRRVAEELESLRSELSKLENGRSDAAIEDASGQKGLANTKLLREVKYHQMLYELLAKQYEAARLDEAKDSSIIQVLDPAIEPERKAKPKRALIVLISALAACLASIAWALMSEARRLHSSSIAQG